MILIISPLTHVSYPELRDVKYEYLERTIMIIINQFILTYLCGNSTSN
jgi:hypothetical protein